MSVNYWHISILTAINKVFERILHTPLVKYIEENKLLPHFQHRNKSQAISDINNFLSKALNDKQITLAIFMDLSEAIDTVAKTILSKK